MNKYTKDSLLFLKDVSKSINKEINDYDLIKTTFTLALGLERLIKGILYDVNPTYIFIEPDFKHSAKNLYGALLIQGNERSKQLSDKPILDVLTFSNSLLRAELFSKTIFTYKNTLFQICNARDIIAHCDLDLLNMIDLSNILKRDFYCIIKSFSLELKIPQYSFFEGKHIKLSRLSSELQTDLDTKFDLIKDTQLGIYKLMIKQQGYKEDKDKTTKQIMSFPFKRIEICPVCENDAIIYLQPIISPDSSIIGATAKKIKCQYCKLEINDPAMLDKLDIKGDIYNIPKCAKCGELLGKESPTELCDICEAEYQE